MSCPYSLHLGDCIEVLKDVQDASVGMVLCDLPYGALNRANDGASWDTPIPLEPLWGELLRVSRANAAIVLFAQGMFTARLMTSRPRLWRYNLVYQKLGRASGFLNARRMPLRAHEDICVFYRRPPVYHPQMVYAGMEHANHSRGTKASVTNRCYGAFGRAPDVRSGWKHPRSVLAFRPPHPAAHPTQKPVDLCRWLIRSYTNPGDTVLDCCMGSGTTGVAAVLEDRAFVGIENEPSFFALAERRVTAAAPQPLLPLVFADGEGGVKGS